VAIYRPPRPRWPAVLVGCLAGVLVGLGIGYAIGDDEADPEELVLQVRDDLRGVAALLDVAAVEYEESVSGGRVVSRQEYEGARSAVARARRRYEPAGQVLEGLGHEAGTSIEEGFDELRRLMEEPASPEQVGREIERLVALLEGSSEGG
jgi:hypothetical protein